VLQSGAECWSDVSDRVSSVSSCIAVKMASGSAVTVSSSLDGDELGEDLLLLHSDATETILSGAGLIDGGF